jgi:MiaB/RimO family radical SAM methylthiotransferase
MKSFMENRENKLFSTVNHSCSRRGYEINQIENALLRRGWSKTDDTRNSDLVLFLTCGFTKSHTKHMISELSRTKIMMKEGSLLVVGGCLPKIDPKALKQTFQGLSITPTDFGPLEEVLGIKITEHAGGGSIIPKSDSLVHFLIEVAKSPTKVLSLARGNKSAVDMFVGKGCSRNCSFCASRFATGPLTSRKLAVIMEEFGERLKTGCTKFNLKGDCVGDYGLDIGADFAQLLEGFSGFNATFSLGLNDIHPDSFLKFFNAIDTLCTMRRVHSIQVAVESGSPRILRLMNRECDIVALKDALRKIREYQGVWLITSIIIGFPTETEEDFDETLRFLKEVEFDLVFPHFYSDVPGTEASRFAGKIDKDKMMRRYQKLKKAKIRYDTSYPELEQKYL